MRPLCYTKMVVSFHDGWDEVQAIHPAIATTLARIILPFSLIPPLMLLYAGSHHPAAYLVDARWSQWQDVAALFLVAELLSVFAMAWAIQKMAAVRNLQAAYKDTLLLAAITAIPMWLSAFGLLIPNLWITVSIAALGVITASSLLYHGTFSILRMEDEVEAQALSYAAFSVGIFVWAMLCAFLVLPLMH